MLVFITRFYFEEKFIFSKNFELRKFLEYIFSNTVVCETLTVFTMPRIRKNGQCLEVQVDKTFLEFLSEITIFKVSRSYKCLIYSRSNYDFKILKKK